MEKNMTTFSSAVKMLTGITLFSPYNVVLSQMRF